MVVVDLWLWVAGVGEKPAWVWIASVGMGCRCGFVGCGLDLCVLTVFCVGRGWGNKIKNKK